MNNNNNRRPQDDLPYERRMLYIIRDYRRLFGKLDEVTAYAKSLEQQLSELGEKRAKTATANRAMTEKLKEARSECKRLKAQIQELESRLKSRFSNARCCVCGKQVTSGYVWDGKSVICSDDCGHIIFDDDHAAFDILVDEGKRMVWHDDLTEI